KVIAVAMCLDIGYAATATISVRFVGGHIGVQGRMGRTQAGEVIAEDRDVYTVAPKGITLEIVRVVSLKQFHVGGCEVPRIETGFGRIRIPASHRIVEVVIGDDVATSRATYGDDLVGEPTDVVFNQAIARSIIDIHAVLATWIRIQRIMEE